MIKTILFDWDGTLLDSNQLINESNLYALNKHGDRLFTEEDVKPFNGPPLKKVYQELYPDKAEVILNAYREFNDTQHDEMVQLFKGVEKVLRLLKEKGIKLGVVSMKRRHMVERGIRLFGLDDVFEVVIGGNDCVKHKPDKEPIERAMNKLEATKETTLMVGDNWQDIESANNAGIQSVFVKWSQKPYEIVAPYQPTFCIDSMDEILNLVEKGM